MYQNPQEIDFTIHEFWKAVEMPSVRDTGDFVGPVDKTIAAIKRAFPRPDPLHTAFNDISVAPTPMESWNHIHSVLSRDQFGRSEILLRPDLATYPILLAAHLIQHAQDAIDPDATVCRTLLSQGYGLCPADRLTSHRIFRIEQTASSCRAKTTERVIKGLTALQPDENFDYLKNEDFQIQKSGVIAERQVLLEVERAKAMIYKLVVLAYESEEVLKKNASGPYKKMSECVSKLIGALPENEISIVNLADGLLHLADLSNVIEGASSSENFAGKWIPTLDQGREALGKARRLLINKSDEISAIERPPLVISKNQNDW